MATKKRGGKPKAGVPQVEQINEIIIPVPHDAAKKDVRDLVKAALHHKSVTDALETKDPVVVRVVENGSRPTPWPWPWPKPKP
jgi:hypothetical protein